MSTRCNIHFCESDGTVVANVYRHSDGYPEEVLPDLQRFFAEVEKQCGRDTRFDDPEYLAAKFVVWQAGEFAHDGKPLAFLSLGVCLQDHSDIEHIYNVCCGSGARPRVEHRPVGGD